MRLLGSAGLLVLTLALGAADLHQEMAAWAPIPSRQTGVIPAEHRPVEELYQQYYGLAMLSAGLGDRLNGLVLVERDDDELADAQAVIGYTWGDHGGPDWWFANAYRGIAYLRAGSDPLAADAGEDHFAIGGGVLNSLSGGPFMLWGEIGHSGERDVTLGLEAAFCFLHLRVDHDEDVTTSRWGLNFRWPGGPLARTPTHDPWSFNLAIDAAKTTGSVREERGLLIECTVGWRVTEHLLLAGDLRFANDIIAPGDPSREGDGLFAASLGLGWSF